MSFPAYPEYKDSGVEWLGKVPAGWKVKRLGSQFAERRETVNDTDYPPLSVTKKGIVPQLENAAKTDAKDNRKRVAVDDFVINSRSDRKNSAGVSSYDGSVSLINTVLQPRQAVDPNFIHYLLRTTEFAEEFYRYGHGIVADLWTTRYSEMKAIMLAMPPREEQRAIAAFLDRETAKIDAAVAAQERLVALLAEKRAATISHAVTKGIDPDAPMKDSGIEWLGQIPAHWDVKRLRYLARLNPSKSELDQDADAIVSFLPMEAIGERGTLDLTATRAIEEVASGYTYFGENDVTVAKITPCFENGKGAVMRGLRGGIGFGTTELIVIRPSDEIRPAFLKLITDTVQFRRLGEGWMYGAGGQKRVPDAFVENFPIATPNVTEQDEIVAEVERRMQVFEKLEEKARVSIDLMRERRAALISAAVTGKIDVRGAFEAQEQEAA